MQLQTYDFDVVKGTKIMISYIKAISLNIYSKITFSGFWKKKY